MADIREYTLGQFQMFLKAEEQLAAEERIATVSDLGTVVGSLFSKEDPVGEHLGQLGDVAAGVTIWPQQPPTSKSESKGKTNSRRPSPNSNPE